MSSFSVIFLLLWSIYIWLSWMFRTIHKIYKGKLTWQISSGDCKSLVRYCIVALLLQLTILIIALFVIDNASNEQYVVLHPMIVVFAMALVVFFIGCFITMLIITMSVRSK
jgi:hypothetical protein